MRKLFGLLDDPSLRPQALRCISLIAVGETDFSPPNIIQEMVFVLQSIGGIASTDANILELRKGINSPYGFQIYLTHLEILSTLCYIFYHNENAKDAFKNVGGIIWIVAVWHGLFKCILFDSKDEYKLARIETASDMAKEVASLDTSESTDTQNTANDASQNSFILKIFFFLRVLLHTLSIVLKGKKTNLEYFRNNIQFSTLSGICCM